MQLSHNIGASEIDGGRKRERLHLMQTYEQLNNYGTERVLLYKSELRGWIGVWVAPEVGGAKELGCGAALALGGSGQWV